MRMRTYTGRMVDPFSIEVSDFSLHDIAHSLSLINRYGGHTAWPINVAQHSIIVHDRVCTLTRDIELRLWALMHDAHEAYLGDIIRPLLVNGYSMEWVDEVKDARDYIDIKLCDWLGIETDVIHDELIQTVDREACYMEGHLAFNADVTDSDWGGYIPKWDDQWFTGSRFSRTNPGDDEADFRQTLRTMRPRF